MASMLTSGRDYERLQRRWWEGREQELETVGASDEKCIASWPSSRWTGIETARHSGDMPVLAAVLGWASGDRQRCAAPSRRGLLEYGSLWRVYPVLGAAYSEVAGSVARVLGDEACAIRTAGAHRGTCCWERSTPQY